MPYSIIPLIHGIFLFVCERSLWMCANRHLCIPLLSASTPEISWAMGINPRDEARSQQDNIAFALLTQEHHGSPGAQWWLLSDKIVDELHFIHDDCAKSQARKRNFFKHNNCAQLSSLR